VASGATEDVIARRVLIVGGVAGGASCAARLRRLDESAEIVLFDRGPHVSFANCGLPYFVGDVIAEARSLLVASPQLFRDRFRIEVKTRHEVTAIDRVGHAITVRDLTSGRESAERYDALVLSPGAAPIRPPLPGIDLPGIFAVRNIPDSVLIRAWIDERKPSRAVVVGGGFIGLEMAENLAHRGLAVTVLEKLPQVMPPLDAEMAVPVAEHLRAQGVTLRLGDGLAGFERAGDELIALTDAGARIAGGLVILALGVRPETGLAAAAGLALGPRGGIVVDAHMRTADPAIWAMGDAVEVRDGVTGQEVILPLAGPANRQGRVAAEAVAGPGTVRTRARSQCHRRMDTRTSAMTTLALVVTLEPASSVTRSIARVRAGVAQAWSQFARTLSTSVSGSPVTTSSAMAPKTHAAPMRTTIPTASWSQNRVNRPVGACRTRKSAATSRPNLIGTRAVR